LFCDVIMLAGYLKNRAIKFCMFNWAQGYHDYEQSLMASVSRIKNIVSLIDFSANVYLYNQGARCHESEQHLHPGLRHYNSEDYCYLETYLYDYCVRNQLI
jgi:hypothetical protein